MKQGKDQDQLKDQPEGGDFSGSCGSIQEGEVEQVSGSSDGSCQEDPGDLEKLLASAQDHVERLEADNKALVETAARARADFFNYRQRMEREQERFRQTATEGAAASFIPVLDNLDRARSSPQSDFESLLKGVEMVRGQFFSALQGLGVSVIETVGKHFDPAFHEAVAVEEPADEEDEGRVTAEIQPGYMIAGKVLRAARVKVARSSSS